MIKYRPEVDGLRTIAVIPVILFHLGYNWISGGYFGVDVFFVISGFLITSIILKDVASGTFSMQDFWLRRVRRILPAIITVIIATLIIAPFVIFNTDIIALVFDSLAAMFSYANFSAWFKLGDYWGAAAENSFFLHAWSLSVEEQFYLFYPLFILLIYKLKLSIPKWLFIVVIISFIAFLIGSFLSPIATFYLLPTRAWELASGGLLAALFNSDILQKERIKRSSFYTIIGVTLILSSYFIFTGNDGVNIFAILPVLGAVLIIAFASENNFVGQFLGSPSIVFIGKISYSLYLWHWPIIVLLHNTEINENYKPIIALILTIILSILSYYLVENTTRKSEYTPKLVLGMVFVTLTMSLYLLSPLTIKETPSAFNDVIFHGRYYDISPQNVNTSKNKSNNFWNKYFDWEKIKKQGTFQPERETKYNNAYKENGIITDNSSNQNPAIIVLGDSHGAMWAKVIDEIALAHHQKVSFYTAIANLPFFNIKNIEKQRKTKNFSEKQRVEYAKSLFNNIQKWKPKLLIFSCRWEYINQEQKANFEDILNYTKEHNIQVLLLNQPPVIEDISDRNTKQYLAHLGYKPNGQFQYIDYTDKLKIEKSNQILLNYATKYTNIHIFDVYHQLVINNKVTIISNKDILYYDDDHLSYQGTLLFKNDLAKAILSNL